MVALLSSENLYIYHSAFKVMAAMLKKLSGGVNIDESLTSEGAESELSLADDTDEFAESFSGTLKISLSQSFPDEHGKRRLLRTGFSEEGSDGVDIPVVSAEPEKQKVPAGVTFEIVNARIVKEGRHKYVSYSVQVSRPGVDSSHAIVERRYSDFDHLNTALRKLYPSLMVDISFPTKKVTGNFKAETIAQRSRGFEQYLTHVYSVDVLCASPEFAAFFYEHDLDRAYSLLQEGNPRLALPLFRMAAQLQQKLLGEQHPYVGRTLCAVVAAAAAAENDCLAQGYAEAALACVGYDSHTNEYLVPLLQASIRLCWKLGKDKKDLEAALQTLRDRGVVVDNAPALLDLVVQRNRRR